MESGIDTNALRGDSLLLLWWYVTVSYAFKSSALAVQRHNTVLPATFQHFFKNFAGSMVMEL